MLSTTVYKLKLQWLTKGAESIVKRDDNDPELSQDVTVNRSTGADFVWPAVNKHHHRVTLSGIRRLHEIDYIVATLTVVTIKPSTV